MADPAEEPCAAEAPRRAASEPLPEDLSVASLGAMMPCPPVPSLAVTRHHQPRQKNNTQACAEEHRWSVPAVHTELSRVTTLALVSGDSETLILDRGPVRVCELGDAAVEPTAGGAAAAAAKYVEVNSFSRIPVSRPAAAAPVRPTRQMVIPAARSPLGHHDRAVRSPDKPSSSPAPSGELGSC